MTCNFRKLHEKCGVTPFHGEESEYEFFQLNLDDPKIS